MAELYQRQSPLAHLGLEARARVGLEPAGVLLGEAPFRGQIALRGDAGNETFTDAVKEIFGADLPVEPNTATTPAEGGWLLWLGPDEWLAIVPDGSEGELIAAFRERVAGEHCAVADVSGSRTVIRLAGDRARDLLQKGTSLDLHPRVFSAGRCAQSGMARCHMLLHQIDDTPAYEIHVHRSFADYLWRWLEDAAREYGVSVIS